MSNKKMKSYSLVEMKDKYIGKINFGKRNFQYNIKSSFDHSRRSDA